MRRLLLIAVLFLSPLFGARAQGQPCDSTLQVSIEAIPVGGTSWVFLAVVDTGNYSLVNISWSMGDMQASVEYGSYINFDYAIPGTYLVCVTVTAEDDLGQYCETTVCEVVLVDPAPSNLCDSANIDFSGSFDNGAFTFTVDDSSGVSVFGVDWSFGDGSYGTGDPVTHTFSGNGPFEVCMTAYVLDQLNQDSCETTVCHWVYFGPDTLPCEQILIPSFTWSGNGIFCAFFNTSFTLGSTGSVLWNFGDGTYSTEDSPIHEFPMMGSFEVCLTVALWGGLAPDTCALTACMPINMYTAARVEETSAYDPPSLWPVPSSDALHVSVPQGASMQHWSLFDTQGRALRRGNWPSSGPLDLDLAGMSPGMYVLRLEGAHHSWNARFTKQ